MADINDNNIDGIKIATPLSDLGNGKKAEVILYYIRNYEFSDWNSWLEI